MTAEKEKTTFLFSSRAGRKEKFSLFLSYDPPFNLPYRVHADDTTRGGNVQGGCRAHRGAV